MAVTLTENALNRVRAFVAGRGDAAGPASGVAAIGLRIGVKRTGCSGLAYVVNYAEAVTANDEVFDQDGVAFIVRRRRSLGFGGASSMARNLA